MALKCPYIEKCTLYSNENKRSALVEDVRKSMCEGIDEHGAGAPVFDYGVGVGSGTICEAYLSRKALEELIKTAQNTLKMPVREKQQHGGW